MRFVLKTFIGFLLVIPFSLSSQMNIGNNIDSDLSVNNLEAYAIGTFDNRSTAYEGNPLIWGDDWRYGKVRLKDTDSFTSKDFKFTYDGLKHILYVQLGQETYSLYLSQIDELRLISPSQEVEIFKVYNDEMGVPKLFRLIHDGDYALLSFVDVKVGKPTYNTALDVGSVRPRLIKNDVLYIKHSGKLYELQKSRKLFNRQYKSDENAEELINVFKKNRVNTKSESDVILALNDLNKIK
jgi:hypothetical protein